MPYRRCFHKTRFDAVLLDFPALDGDALSQVTLLAVQAPRAPILVLGPADDEHFAAEVVRAGAQDYLPKAGLGNARLAKRHPTCD